MTTQTSSTLKTVTSKDGSTISFEQAGSGPALIVAYGAIQNLASDSARAERVALLAPHFTVFHYDRRGRGQSTDTPPYAPQREIDDLEALIDYAGGAAFVWGHSSGAALALRAAATLGDKIPRLALYDAPYSDEPSASEAWKEYRQQLGQTLAAGGRGDALRLFMRKVGLPETQLAAMSVSPFWARLQAVAPTLAYDADLLGPEAAVPADLAAQVACPTLVMAGGASPTFMQTTAHALAEAMPHGQYLVLTGQTHEVSAAALAPALVEFFQN